MIPTSLPELPKPSRTPGNCTKPMFHNQPFTEKTKTNLLLSVKFGLKRPIRGVDKRLFERTDGTRDRWKQDGILHARPLPVDEWVSADLEDEHLHVFHWSFVSPEPKPMKLLITNQDIRKAWSRLNVYVLGPNNSDSSSKTTHIVLFPGLNLQIQVKIPQHLFLIGFGPRSIFFIGALGYLLETVFSREETTTLSTLLTPLKGPIKVGLGFLPTVCTTPLYIVINLSRPVMSFRASANHKGQWKLAETYQNRTW